MSASAPIVWTPSALRRALSARIADASGLVEVAQVAGAGAAPSQVAARCFALRSDDAEPEGPGRSGDSIAIRRRWIVDLLHAADPHAGPACWDEALDDERAVRMALLLSRSDALAAVEHRIRWLGSAAPILEGGGAYRRVSLRFEIVTTECLE